jgi:hypothetical protein
MRPDLPLKWVISILSARKIVRSGPKTYPPKKPFTNRARTSSSLKCRKFFGRVRVIERVSLVVGFEFWMTRAVDFECRRL